MFILLVPSEDKLTRPFFIEYNTPKSLTFTVRPSKKSACTWVMNMKQLTQNDLLLPSSAFVYQNLSIVKHFEGQEHQSYHTVLKVPMGQTKLYFPEIT